MDISYELEQLPKLIKERGKLYAKYQSEYENLKDNKEVILAKIMNDITANSETERKRRALASEAYEIHLAGLKEARYQSLEYKSLYEAVKIRFELVRSLNARETALAKVL